MFSPAILQPTEVDQPMDVHAAKSIWRERISVAEKASIIL
jgi:hypothetical protein